MSSFTSGSKPNGHDSVRRAGMIHRSIVSLSVVMTMALGVVLAKLHPGVSANSGTNSSASTSSVTSGSSGLSSNSTVGSASAPAAPVTQAPITATGGS